MTIVMPTGDSRFARRDGHLRVERFNFLCRVVALFWLLGALPVSQIVRTRYDDFPQYYLGAIAVAADRWDLLYPIPTRGAVTNAGFVAGAQPKADLLRLAATRGLHEPTLYFIQLPPVALLIMPLGYLRLDEAHAVWTLICSGCAAAVILQLERIARICLGRQTYAIGILMLAAALCPSMYRAVRVSNVSTIIPALLGWSALDLLRATGPRAAVPIVLASVVKYVGGVLILLAAIVGRWKTILWTGVFTAALFGITAVVGGVAVFREWAVQIAPTLGRGTWQADNQSIEAFLLRVTQLHPLPPQYQIGIHLTRWGVLVILLVMIFRRRKTLLREPPSYFAASAALLAWMMIFSPISWNHYIVYLFPFWGWLAWELTRGWLMRIGAIIAITMALVPTSAYKRIAMPEPYNSHVMGSAMLVMLMGAARLGSSGRQIDSGQSPAPID